LFKKPKI